MTLPLVVTVVLLEKIRLVVGIRVGDVVCGGIDNRNRWLVRMVGS